jgi:YesN/AraC family two-component response regulator
VLADDNEVVGYNLNLGVVVNEDLPLVGEASNGSEAIFVCALQKPDLVLMDNNMPSMTFVKNVQM